MAFCLVTELRAHKWCSIEGEVRLKGLSIETALPTLSLVVCPLATAEMLHLALCNCLHSPSYPEHIPTKVAAQLMRQRRNRAGNLRGLLRPKRKSKDVCNYITSGPVIITKRVSIIISLHVK